MWAAWTLLFVCAVVQGATLKDNGFQGLPSIETTALSYFDFNKIADTLIKMVNEDIVQQNKNELPLPDVQEESIINLGFLEVKYKLSASQGKVGSIASFKRSGQVVETKDSKESLQVVTPVSMGQLHIRYGFYDIEVIGLHVTGKIGGSFDGLSLEATIYGQEEGLGCTASLKDIKVADLGRITVDITGLGPLNGVISSVLEWFMKKRESDIVMIVEEVLLQEIGVVLRDYDCDELNSLFLLSDF